MKSLLVQLDEQTLSALNRIASPGKRLRSEFVRQAIRRAVRHAEFAAMRDAYRGQPDSADDADDWSTADEYKP
jgi:metal-responsive CopG/Arc/MetJ family transcriptional regulator